MFEGSKHQHAILAEILKKTQTDFFAKVRNEQALT
jgi:hypothetical protein